MSRSLRVGVGLGVLAVLLIGILWWAGAFAPTESDTAQIVRLNEVVLERINEHDWDGVADLCNLTPDEADRWVEGVPQPANWVTVDKVVPLDPVSVPHGATEYALEVNVYSHIQMPMGRRLNVDSRTGTIWYVKKDDRWRIDLRRSAPTLGVPSLP